ncbi:MAG: hypothetical protein QM811_23040 [Pirellulales bacterium]
MPPDDCFMLPLTFPRDLQIEYVAPGEAAYRPVTVISAENENVLVAFPDGRRDHVPIARVRVDGEKFFPRRNASLPER